MTRPIDFEPLAAVAGPLRDVLDGIAARFGADVRISRDEQLDCDPFRPAGAPSESVRWEYNLRVPTPPDAAEILLAEVVPALTADGWRATDRSSVTELAYQFQRDGTNLGVHVSRDGTGDVVVGGSSRCVPTGA
ncbi:hypothetical protein ONA91_15875 [Micromonospora sp. DR5-3]|uniref:hypothetical protein n=1 Tax=unclassified Micromonospora TaxID=2617518 RepID=UPI0011D49591|nr:MULTISPECIES: hypothetical protein [unclassified Micromonospora]MCW3815922.1 hypothetical protein [Micromonospora sp. DR5-3]TYC24422.1 hypothetical protein FXF52_10505 [Micromonospora sp. MP36]